MDRYTEKVGAMIHESVINVEIIGRIKNFESRGLQRRKKNKFGNAIVKKEDYHHHISA